MPVAVTLKRALCPALTVVSAGCVMIDGGAGVAVGVGVGVGVGVAVGVGVGAATV